MANRLLDHGGPGEADVGLRLRDQDIAAEIIGNNIFHYKLWAFAISSFYAGVTGVLSAFLDNVTTILLVGSLLAVLLSVDYARREGFHTGEYYFLLLASVLGMTVMASSRLSASSTDTCS